MKKIQTIEQSQLMNSEEMKNSHGGMTCPNENGVYNTCSLTNFYMNCPSLTLYKICGDYISEPCVIHETCTNLFQNCINNNYVVCAPNKQYDGQP